MKNENRVDTLWRCSLLCEMGGCIPQEKLVSPHREDSGGGGGGMPQLVENESVVQDPKDWGETTDGWDNNM